MTTIADPPAPDQAARERIRHDLDTTLLVEAAAGTGKTTSLVGRMVELIATGRCEVGRIAAVTFTRKAAAELRGRFTAQLERENRASSGERAARLAAALCHAERCFIGTIHSFCARLLRERPIEAGVDPAFEEIDGDADASLRERAWEEFVAELFAAGDPRVVRLADIGIHLGQLKASFEVFATYPDVEEWPAPEVRLGDLAPARQALERYLARIRALVPTFPEERGTDRLMARYESIERLARHRDLSLPVRLLEVLEEFDRPHGAVQKFWPGGARGGVKAEIESWDVFRDEVAGSFVARWLEMRYAAVIPLLQAAVAVYDRLRFEAGVLNFQDLLLKSSRLLRDQPRVRAYFRRRFTHLFVDEFQDTDPLQAEVVLFLTAADPEQNNWRACRPVPGSLFVVGDPKQSIYRFRRADIVTYQTVKGIIRESGGGVVELDASFRTLPELVAWGNDIFAPPVFPSVEDRYAPAAHPLAFGRPAAAPGSGLDGILTITVTGPPAAGGSEDTDAHRIARFIRHALDAKLPVLRPSPRGSGGKSSAPAAPGDFLIVTWRRRHLHLYGAALQQLGIPHLVSGGSAWGQVSELGLLAGALRAIAEPENPVALVGALRGEIFGISDVELYDFKKAGGRFSYNAPAPQGLEAPARGRFEDAFARLQRGAGWLRTLPPVAALERIAADLGLMLRALAGPGGDGRAGSIGKAFAVLRAQSADLGSAAGIVDLLERLIEEETPFDGLPARAPESAVVRVMNLHKVKGLEAPVVFLADPGGKPRGGCLLHVDRTGERSVGYLAVEQRTGQFSHKLLAHPHDWDEYEEEEKSFAAAERNRLLYVAATRAGSRLVVTRRPGRGSHFSPWEFFRDWLTGAPELPDPGPQRAPSSGSVTVTAADFAEAETAVAARWRQAGAATYELRGAKEIAVSAAELHRRPAAGEHGTEWGTVIHFLLETALREPGCDLAGRARAALEEQGLPTSRAAAALALVAAVQASEIWRRAAAAERVLVEVPFEICLQPGDPLLPALPPPHGGEARGGGGAVPLLVRGVIDLAFCEAAGWVIVDWKTDAVRTPAELAARTRHYAPQVRLYADIWTRITGAPVAERGLFFTAGNRYELL
ncbi:MAG: UvrD-helicase domain-containing protein [Candidatus Methylomirabilia bacterium]